jgi:3-oxoacyl-[acyl-carrier protein] reductase
MELGIAGRVALVTASSKGIGKAIALELAREGAKLSLCARDEAVLGATAEEIRAATGAEVMATKADMSQAGDVERLVRSTLDTYGRIDIVVCNAGGPPSGEFMDFDDAAWEKAFQQNLMSTVRLCRLCVPSMKERRWGRIITVPSSAAREPLDRLVLSNVMRAGVAALVKTLGTELGPSGILVNNVMPYLVLTDRIRNLEQRTAEKAGRSVDEMLQESAKSIPVGYIASPEEFAQLALFLASERSSYVNGSSFAVDGGALKSIM